MSSSPTDPETAHATRGQPDQLRRSRGVNLDLQSRRLLLCLEHGRHDPLGQIAVAVVEASDGEANAGRVRGELVSAAQDHLRKVAQNLLRSRAGQDRHQLAGATFLIGQEIGIERTVLELVEVRMTNIDRVGNPSGVVPSRLEGEAAEDEVDVLLNFLDAQPAQAQICGGTK